MAQFDFYNPIRFMFGKGQLARVGKATKEYGSRVLIVTYPGSSQLLQTVIRSVEEAGLEHVIFDKVTANPISTLIYEGANVAQKEKCDVVIGIGGGSAMDAAKAIAFMAKNDGDIFDYIYGKPGAGALPIILITTTAGTGSEGNMGAIVTNPETKDKKALKTPLVYPKVSIVDPEVFLTLPKRQIAGPGVDALFHAIEAYIGKNCNLMTEMYALQAIALLAQNLPVVYEDVNNVEAWEKVALANTLAGVIIGTSGTCLPHGLAQPVGGLFNAAHGETVAAVFIPAMEFIQLHVPQKLAMIAKAMGEDIEGLSVESAAVSGIEGIKRLMKKVDMTPRLRDFGMTEEHVDWLTDNAWRTNIANIENTPRVASREEFRELYLKSL